MPKTPTKAERERALVLPPIERGQHDRLEAVEIRDEEGWPAQTFRVVDAIGRLLRAREIDRQTAEAAGRFKSDFRRAHLDPLRAPALGRLAGQAYRPVSLSEVTEEARVRVAEALSAVGGVSSISGSVLWHVIGADLNLREWASQQVFGRRQSGIHLATARGILIAALFCLAAAYERMNEREAA